MKKLLLSLVICLGLVSFASQTIAQSTAVEPYDGATHTYTFANVEDGASYEFYVSTSTTAFGATDELKSNEFGTFATSATGSITGGPGPAAVTINWDSDVSTNYGAGLYLYLKVTASGDPCTGPGNYKAVHIMPKSNLFDISIAANAGNPSCASLAGLEPVVNTTDIDVDADYVAGTTSMTFDITVTGSDAWTGGYDVTCDIPTVSFSVNGGVSTIATKSVGFTNETAKTLTVTILMTNSPGTTPTFTVAMTSATDVLSGVSDATLGSDDQAINLMPAIGGFTGS